jgi:hypothetical protein
MTFIERSWFAATPAPKAEPFAPAPASYFWFSDAFRFSAVQGMELRRQFLRSESAGGGLTGFRLPRGQHNLRAAPSQFPADFKTDATVAAGHNAAI